MSYSSQETYIGFLPLAHIFEICAEIIAFARGSRVGYSSSLTLFDGAPGLQNGQRGDCAVLQPTIFGATPVNILFYDFFLINAFPPALTLVF